MHMSHLENKYITIHHVRIILYILFTKYMMINAILKQFSINQLSVLARVHIDLQCRIPMREIIRAKSNETGQIRN